MDKLVIYISGPYTGKTPEETIANVVEAEAMGVEVMKLGCVPLVPHTMTREWDRFGFSWEQFIEVDLELLSRCDAILMLPRWRDSKGAVIEHDSAKAEAIPIFYDLNDLRVAFEMSEVALVG